MVIHMGILRCLHMGTHMGILMHLLMVILMHPLMDFIMDFLMDFLIDCHIICHMDLLTVHHMEHIMLPRMCPHIMLLLTHPLMEFHMVILMDTPMPHPIMKLDPMKLRPLMELLLTLMQLTLGINPDIIQPILTDPHGYHLMVPHPTHLLMVLLHMHRLIWHLEELHPHPLMGLLMNPLKGRLMEPLPLGESLKIESYSLSNQMVIMQLVTMSPVTM